MQSSQVQLSKRSLIALKLNELLQNDAFFKQNLECDGILVKCDWEYFSKHIMAIENLNVFPQAQYPRRPFVDHVSLQATTCS